MDNLKSTFEEREAEYQKEIARLEKENKNLKSQLKQYENNENGAEKTTKEYLTKFGVR